MKKINFIKLFAGVALVAAIAPGCRKFLDVNTTENNLTTTKADWTMSGALGTSMRIQYGGSHIVPGTWSGFYAHSSSFTGAGNEKTYDFTNSDFNFFDEAYDNLNDYQYVINNADKDGVTFWKDPANIMQCYIFQRLVDMYGNVPYTEALKGLNTLAPKYDNQQTIYEDLIKRLDAAIASIKATTWPTIADFTKQDIFFQGNKTNWIKLANTLKLRILLRQSFMAGRDAYITTNILTTATDGYLTTNVLCSPGYQNIAGKLNPYYNTYGYNEVNNVVSNHQFRKMNRVIINWLKTGSLDTFRLQSLAWPAGATVIAPLPTTPPTPNTLTSYVGVPLAGNGSTAATSGMGYFQINRGTSTRPAIFMTAAESYLLQAEASFRYPTVAAVLGAAQTLYETGIQTHFRLCADPTQVTPAANALADAAYSRYIARPIDNVNWAVSTNKLRAILIQKWVALCHVNGLEAWSEYRKSSIQACSAATVPFGVPATVFTTAGTSHCEPVRLYYPLNETNTNGNNVPAGIDVYTSKIFWDVN